MAAQSFTAPLRRGGHDCLLYYTHREAAAIKDFTLVDHFKCESVVERPHCGASFILRDCPSAVYVVCGIHFFLQIIQEMNAGIKKNIPVILK
jgi:hypothetical protein